MKLLPTTVPTISLAETRDHAPTGWRSSVIAAIVLGLALLFALRCGKAPIAPDMLAHILAHRLLHLPTSVTWPTGYENILFEIRLPRIVLGALVGSALATAGAGYQGLFRNPLADPYLIGVAAGAGLGAVLAFVLPFPAGLYQFGIVQVLAFAGSLFTVTAVYLLARVGRSTRVGTLILAGIALGALMNAATAYLMYSHGDKLPMISAWLLGGFNVASWPQVVLIAPGVLLSIFILLLHSRLLNVMQLGEEQSASLGMHVERAKMLLIFASTLATASAVSVSGLIGFVGLVVPHLTRLLFGPDHRRLIPTSALLGAAFLVIADAVARSLPGSEEVPVGVVTAACGAPFFLFLLRRQKQEMS
jgi:iron complex transport system permease protein